MADRAEGRDRQGLVARSRPRAGSPRRTLREVAGVPRCRGVDPPQRPSHLARVREPRFGRIPLASITAPMVREWVATLSTRNGPAAPRTKRDALRVLRGVLGFAVEDGRIARNPAVGIKVPGTKGTPGVALTLAELRTFVAALTPPHHEVALLRLWPGCGGPSWLPSTSATWSRTTTDGCSSPSDVGGFSTRRASGSHRRGPRAAVGSRAWCRCCRSWCRSSRATGRDTRAIPCSRHPRASASTRGTAPGCRMEGCLRPGRQARAAAARPEAHRSHGVAENHRRREGGPDAARSRDSVDDSRPLLPPANDKDAGR